MATLYNAHFIREKGVPPFTPAQFMPGYKAPAKRGADWKRDKATIEAAWKQDLQTVQLATQALAGTIPAVENSQQTQQFDERAKRAREAKEAGYPAETIRAIMEGRG
jgi:hypothetical protein